MKKVLNITMTQWALRRLPVAFLIAGSGFLPNASAMRWTVDFKNKRGGSYIKASDLDVYTKILNAGTGTPLREIGEGIFIPTLDWFLTRNSLIREIKEIRTETTGVIRKDEEDGKYEVTIVLRNGILDVREAKELLNGVKGAFNIDFINCNGTLDLNEDLKEHAGSIQFLDCEFETVPNCFKGAKKLKFLHTNLAPMNEQLGFDEDAEVGADEKSFVLPQNMCLVDAIVLEKAKNRSQNKTTTNSAMETIAHMKNIEEQLSSPQIRYDHLNKELEEIKRNNKDDAQYKSKITELEKKVKEKDRVIGALSKEIEKLEKDRKKEKDNFVEIMQRKDNKESDLFSLCEVLQTQLKDAIGKNKMYETNIKNMKDVNMKFKKENEKLLKKQKGTKNCMKDLEASKSELEAINEKLEADNNALREEIRKSSETVRTAKETLKKFKDLQERNERLSEASHNKSDKIESLTKNIGEKDRRIRELESLLRIAGSFINNVHPLLRDLKKNDEYIRNALLNAGYDEEVKKFNQSLGKLYEAGKERKKQHKKCDWIDFDFEEPFSVLDDDDNDETYWENKTIYRGRGNFYGRGYRGRGGYRGNCRGRGRGSKPMINKPRGGKRGGEQRDSFDSDNH